MKKICVTILLILVSSCLKRNEIKNVIILVGDGMGPQQLGILSQYARQASHSIYKGRKTGFEKAIEMGTFSLSLTYPGNGLVTDSAASATQFSSGDFAGAEMLGANVKGDPTVTIMKVAKTQGKMTGLVSDTKITHATPAAFVAKSSHRDKEGEIALQLAKSDVDVMLSGGASYWLPVTVNDEISQGHKKYYNLIGDAFKFRSKRKDKKDLIEMISSRGYKTVFTADQLSKVKGKKVLGLFSNTYMPDAIAAKRERIKGVPTLLEMTKKSLEILDKSEKGFVLMVEAGQIDFAGHRNDIGTTLHEMIKFDDVVNYVFGWVKNRSDTVVVITADHETGNPAFSFSRYNLPKGKRLDGQLFNGREYLPNYNFGDIAVLDHIYRQKMSYQEIFANIKKSNNRVEELITLVKENIGYDLTTAEAQRILEYESNKYYKKGHPKLGESRFPRVDDYEEFYVDPVKTPPALLARVLGKYQNIVWSTGTHTSTPVPFIVLGPANIQQKFKKLLHTTQWGGLLKNIVQFGN